MAELPELRKRTGGFVWLDIPEWSEEAEAVLTDDLSGSAAPTSPSWLIESMRPSSTGATWGRSCRTTWSSTTTRPAGT